MEDLMSALTEYVDARVYYADQDPEWRTSPSTDALEAAMRAAIAEGVREALGRS